MKRQIKRSAIAAMALTSGLLVGLSGAAADELEGLRDQIRELERKVDTLERTRETEPAAAPERMIRSGDPNVRLSISGQVNRALLLTRDGGNTNLFHVDNNASSSRVRFIGEAEPSSDLTIGGALEFEFRVNNSFTVGQDNSRGVQGGGGAVNFRDRRVEVYLASKRYGRVWLGKGWTASEFSSEQDLSGTALAGYSDPRVMGGGMRFRSNGRIGGNPRVLDVFDNMDGLGRDVRIRYDTPSFAGLQLRVSAVQGDAYDAALFYDNRFGAARVQAAVAYSNIRRISSGFRDIVNGSASVLLDSGWNATVAGGRMSRNGSGADPVFFYGKLGYRYAFWDFGTTSLSVDYHQTNDLMRSRDRARAGGFQVVQEITDWGAEVYANARVHDLDRSSTNFDPIYMGMTGIRVRF